MGKPQSREMKRLWTPAFAGVTVFCEVFELDKVYLFFVWRVGLFCVIEEADSS
jgi:hypothetical protein